MGRIIVTPLPDFRVKSLSLSASGGSYTIRNAGATSYSGSVQVVFEWLRTDGSVISGAGSAFFKTISLAPGGTDANTIAASFITGAPSDAYRLRVTVDQGKLAMESNETNNFAETLRP